MFGLHHENTICMLLRCRRRFGGRHSAHSRGLGISSFAGFSGGEILGKESITFSSLMHFQATPADDEQPKAYEPREVGREHHRNLDPNPMRIVPRRLRLFVNWPVENSPALNLSGNSSRLIMCSRIKPIYRKDAPAGNYSSRPVSLNRLSSFGAFSSEH